MGYTCSRRGLGCADVLVSGWLRTNVLTATVPVKYLFYLDRGLNIFELSWRRPPACPIKHVSARSAEDIGKIVSG
jgi:hypothetical protein